jgi:hypothetical protein
MLSTLTLAIALASASSTESAPQARPAPPARPAVPAPAVAQDPRLARNVTVEFRSAPVADVLRWLSREGVSFVADESGFAERRVTLNIRNQPLRDAMNALADALGGNWQRRGEVYALRRGVGIVPGAGFDPQRFESLARDMAERMKDVDVRVYERGRALTPEDARKMREELLERARQISPPAPERIRARAGEVRAVRSADLKQLMESLTADQRQTHERQGHLTFDQLTPEQRRMLGDMRGENWTITFTADGRTITVRSK